MKRTNLDLPDEFAFYTDLQIRVDDVNYGDHLGNDRVLTLVHEARIRFLKEHGYTERDIGGPGLIQVIAEVRYKSEGRLGDTLRIHITPDDVSHRGLDIYARLENRTTGKTVALVRTGMIGFHYDREKPVRFPERFIETMRGLTSSS